MRLGIDPAPSYRHLTMDDIPESGRANEDGVSIACTVCGATNCSPLFTKESIPYYACMECTFRFSLPKHNANFENTIDQFEKSYLHYLDEGPGDVRNFEDLIGWISQFHLLDHASVLDVGCGSGKFVRHLRSQGIAAYGLEPARALYDRFLQDDPYFFNLSLEEYFEGSQREFTIITAFDVIEHTAAPNAMISEMSARLEEGGHLFISTPDSECFHARALGKYWHYYNKYHLSYWSRHTLESFAEGLGLSPRYFRHRSRYHSLGYALEYFWERVLGSRAPEFGPRGRAIYIPFNLYDVMYLCFEKRAIEKRNP